jgi:hypothetical protein
MPKLVDIVASRVSDCGARLFTLNMPAPRSGGRACAIFPLGHCSNVGAIYGD